MRPEDGARLRLMRLDGEGEIDRAFVAREAGDEPLDGVTRAEHMRVRDERGDAFFSDLLFVLTHRTYPPERARVLWGKLLQHQREISDAVGAPVDVAVAALDYLTRVERELERPVVLGERQIASAAELATQDAMTGLYDHSSFYLSLHTALQRAERYPEPVSVLLMDVDRFKAFNDRHGHPAGDRVLKRIAAILRDESRDPDLACRYGGEEFAVLAPATGRDDAFALAERLRVRVEQELSGRDVTLSVGVATFPDDAARGGALVSAADAALYRSKAAGRNRTTAADSLAAKDLAAVAAARLAPQEMAT